MDFVKEFAIFLQESGAIKFGNFRLSSGKDSVYYIDLRLVPSFPHQFREMVKAVQNLISEKIGLDSFDYIASVPTSGLVISSALAMETVKPLIYIRQKIKDYGTGSLIEGKIPEGSRVVLVDDVGTTGHSLLGAIKALKDAKIVVDSAFVIVNRLEGARENLEAEKVKLYEITDILTISNILHTENILDEQTLGRIKKQVDSSKIK
ncbi:orotate phosphoribosyltransferase [Candidatus Nitrosotalea okcheonensis]|uniref:Orotate phosphoribosyltransferase n=1 Tax=Candidatus Nitrosotalea okcheonensis TaxID=1903276 RepID=A0A2H1FG98_9ARCH|nr:orotate phosphoribosyltransferase [Candidatus Nitrosotalea okcheonensis]SMH71783.1 Orotate phosphoribosyltransferase [Candidatus Nitrosotalea okcheonensis]